MTWKAGDRAVIDRREVVTIEKVVRGVAVVGTKKFRADGSLIGRGDVWRGMPTLGPLTPEVEAEIAAREAAIMVNRRLIYALDAASDWRRSAMAPVRTGVVDPADVAKAERVAAALEAAMEGE